MQAELFMCFCIKNYIGNQGKLPMVYATDRSEAPVVVLFLFTAGRFMLRL